MKNYFTKLLLILFVFSSSNALALNSADFTITRITAPYFIVDGNSPTIVTKAYVGFEVKNVSASTVSGLLFTVTSIGTSVVGQNYTILAPTSNQQLVGTLAPGASKVCYFFVQYPANVTPTGTFNVKLSDNTASFKTAAISIANRSSISANAGGLTTVSVNNQDLLGGIISFDITYTVGNVSAGDECDFQVSTSPQFDPTKVNLLGTSVTASNIPGISVGATDSLYFISSGKLTSGATVTFRWDFRIVSYNFTNYFLPLAGATSGASNYKYAINTSLGANGVAVSVSSSANPLTITKTSNKSSYTVCEAATFTLTVNNTGAYGITVDSIVDQLPSGFTFTAIDGTGFFNASDCIQSPTAGATGSIKFVGGVSSGTNTSFFIPAGGSRTIKYTAAAPCSPASNLTTTVSGSIGATTFDTDNNTLSVVSATLPVLWNNFTVQLKNNAALLDWSTTHEVNACCYLVQYSNDGINFKTTASVAATGNSNTNNNYSFVHNYSASNQIFYRIAQQDLDGKLSYSKTVLVQSNLTTSNVLLKATIIMNNQLPLELHTRASVEVIGADGRIYKKQSLESGLQMLDIHDLSSGVYMLRSGKTVQRFTKA